MTTQPISHKHHYVPEWYQRRFLEPGKTAFKILDLHPTVFRRPDGSVTGRSREILVRGPTAHFYEPDLYTVKLLGTPNDEIERMLFGPIDLEGKRSIDAFLAQDWNTVHHTYWKMYEFMDALRLRTPKGLDFLRLVFKTETQLQLMYAMQELRRMHCLMWAEGALEILSAAKANEKFIFSDHPVTLFNPYVFPIDADVPRGMDPLLDWMGTQTLFPFDRERLFVLTHLEWTKGQGRSKAKKRRTNARYFDNSMVRYDKCTRNRFLNDEQVLEVNYIMKTRARRFVAGNAVEDLYPERKLKSTMWSRLGRFLLPQNSFGHGGDIFMKRNDGTFYFQDQFGQRPKTKEEFEAKIREAEKVEETMKRALANLRERK